ncbi:MAG: nucleotidyltransferase family protein [bacterium]|nr:nucleotidyltransferase family protein [bacterium]
MLTTDTIQNKLKEHKKYINENYHITNIGIFGSYVKNMQEEKSDIDILVQFKKGHKGFFNYVRLKHYLENIFGKEVDLVMKDAVKSGLKKRIFKEVKYV